jgi:hypothetical protein
MSFHGEVLNTCIPLPFTSTACIIVSGDGPNPCGHALLHTDGHYFHVAGFYDRPTHMDEIGYRKYLADSGKLELGRYRRHMRFPSAAYVKLTTLLAKPWFWGVLPNNCIVFVEEVLQAGGATNFGLYSNCPVLQKNQDNWSKMIDQLRRSVNEMAIRQYMLGRAPF